MLRLIFIIVLIGFAYSCKGQKMIKFPATEDGKKVTYTLNVPEGYTLSKADDYHGYREFRLVYPDSTILYITDDFESGGAINKYKAEKYGEDIYIKILSSDSLDIEGINKGDHWREIKKDKIVVGYINVDPSEKEKFDKALSTLERKSR